MSLVMIAMRSGGIELPSGPVLAAEVEVEGEEYVPVIGTSSSPQPSKICAKSECNTHKNENK